MSKWSTVVVGLLAVHLCLLRIRLCSDWPTYLHDNARTGWTPDGRNGRERWDLRALPPELSPSGRRQKLKRLALNSVHDVRRSHSSKNWFDSEP